VQLTLGEGYTPLIDAPHIASKLDCAKVLIKYEGSNPTGSFKDRGMVAAIGAALGAGVKVVICASTGNTAASAAAYAKRAGMRAIVLIPKDRVARGKIAGALAYGADVVEVNGSFDEALRLVREITKENHSVELVNSTNPNRLQGQMTGAFEICDELGRAPDVLAIPVGNGGNITAYGMGFKVYQSQKGSSIPILLGVQAEGSAPLVLGETVKDPKTVASAIRIGDPVRGKEALVAATSSGGKIIAVSDEAILQAQDILAREGIWVEPASAAGLAGLLQQVKDLKMDLSGKTVVIVCTGHGLKDPDIVPHEGIITIESNIEDLRKLVARRT